MITRTRGGLGAAIPSAAATASPPIGAIHATACRMAGTERGPPRIGGKSSGTPAHLLHSPYAAGQRDFLMSIPAVAAALVSARAAEDHKRRWLYLLLAGAFTMTAASIKPSGILLLFLPALATRLHWREMILILVGAAGVAFLVFGTLAVQGGLGAFVHAVISIELPSKFVVRQVFKFRIEGAELRHRIPTIVEWIGLLGDVQRARVTSLLRAIVYTGNAPGVEAELRHE